jgi:DNA-binding MarR family transcriptional regulator
VAARISSILTTARTRRLKLNKMISDQKREQVLMLPMSLRSAYLSMHRRTNQLLKHLGITADQFVCLLILEQQGELIQSDIVKYANSDPNTVKAMLQLLEKKGLVERKVDPSDRRARVVSITKQGTKIHKSASEVLRGIHDSVENQFEVEELDTINHLLDRYAELLNVRETEDS